MGTGSVKIAGIQFAGIAEEKEKNIETATRLIRRAAATGAQIAMTPEVVLTGFVGGERERKMAEPIPGPSCEHFAALAKELGIYILVGLSELRDGEIMNAVAGLSPQGVLMGAMRKVHINRYETGGGWRNGSAFPVWNFATATGSFCGGIMICYVRELPESARLLLLGDADQLVSVEMGAVLGDVCVAAAGARSSEMAAALSQAGVPATGGGGPTPVLADALVDAADIDDADIDGASRRRKAR